MYTIGYVDESSTEVQTVERALRNSFNVIGYDIPKGLSKEDLIEQIYQSDIDLLLVDYLMRDKGYLTYNGDEVARDYEEIKPKFPVIIFTNNENDAFPVVDDVNIIYDKNLLSQDKTHFIDILTKNINHYKSYIDLRKEKISSLITSREQRDLTPKEKNELFSLQLELGKLDSRTFNDNPNQLLSDGNLDHLSDINKEAEDLLKSLLNNNPDAAV